MRDFINWYIRFWTFASKLIGGVILMALTVLAPPYILAYAIPSFATYFWQMTAAWALLLGLLMVIFEEMAKTGAYNE